MENLDDLFIEDYSQSKYLSEEKYQIIDESHAIELCKIANKHFNYLLQHNNKSGFYFVDWNINFSELKDYFIIQKSSTNTDVISFLQNTELSAEILYERLGIFDDED